MRLTIEAQKLREALDVARGALTTRIAGWPILEHVLLEAADGHLTIHGTDREMHAWHVVSADVSESGGAALPPRQVVDFLDAVAPDASVTLSVNEQHKAELTSGKTRARVAGLDPEQYPVRPDFGAPIFDAVLPADILTTLIGSVAFAASPDDSRPVLAGVLVRSDGERVRMVAADGYRLALREAEVEAPELTAIVHGRALSKAAGTIAKAASVRLTVDRNRSAILLDTEVGCWTARLIDGDFPDFMRIIPRETPIVVTVDRTALLRATGLIRNIVMVEKDGKGRETRTTRAYLTVGADTLTVRARATDSDREGEAVLDAALERGDGLEIVFNGAYFRDAVEAISGPRVTIELTAQTMPAVIREAGPRNGHLQVVMPMHIARPGA